MPKEEQVIGPVEAGVRTTFVSWGILEPTSAWECMAINLAQILDGTSTTYTVGKTRTGQDEKVAVASINQQLLKTLEKIEITRPAPVDSGSLEDKY
jgi:hypothetical protein